MSSELIESVISAPMLIIAIAVWAITIMNVFIIFGMPMNEIISADIFMQSLSMDLASPYVDQYSGNVYRINVPNGYTQNTTSHMGVILSGTFANYMNAPNTSVARVTAPDENLPNSNFRVRSIPLLGIGQNVELLNETSSLLFYDVWLIQSGFSADSAKLIHYPTMNNTTVNEFMNVVNVSTGV